jgi:MurNAc alpha-1-phosphate uridylyltransferase
MSFTHAMILAAGRGERLRPLTDTLPKPLAPVRGKPLIVYHLEKLARLGLQHVVINLAWLAERLRSTLGNGERWGLTIHYSEEGPQALEAGGGIFRALPLLSAEPFLVVNGDVFTDFDFGSLSIEPEALAHLVMVPNPAHRPHGDFALTGGRLSQQGAPLWTYAGIGLFRPELFDGCREGRFPLLPLLQRAIALGRLYGELYEGPWADVASPRQLTALQ